MRKFTKFMLSALLLASAGSVYAAAVEQNPKATFNPSLDSQLTEFPESFTITFEADGLTEVKGHWLSGNPVYVIEPGKTAMTQCPATYSGTTVTIRTNPSINRNLTGEYIVQLIGGEQTRFFFGTDVYTALPQEFRYKVVAPGSDPGTGDEDNIFNIKMTAFQPRTSYADPTVDVSQKTFKTVQMTFDAGHLMPVEGAMLRLKGPGYNQLSTIQFNAFGLNPDAATIMKAGMGADPKYNGEYTLTIPQGVIGDAAYLADPETGHANMAIEYKFNIIGGKDMTANDLDTSLGIMPSIPMGSEVNSFDDLTFKFEEKVYFNPSTKITVKRMTDLQATSYSNYGTASLTRVSDTEVKLTVDPTPTATANLHDYLFIVPEATFWNEEYETNKPKGLVNGACEFNWYLIKEVTTVEVTDHSPATNAYVDGFKTGEGITFNTSDDSLVEKLVLTLTKYENDNDMDTGTKVLNAVESTDKTEDGAPCWLNKGEFMPLDKGYWYEVSATFFNETGDEIADCTFEFYGNTEPAAPDVETFNLTPSIADKATVESLEGLTFTFEDKVYYDLDAKLVLKGTDYEGNITLSRDADNDKVINVTIDPLPVATETAAEYTLAVPQGIFWDKAKELTGTGAVNAAATYTWTLKKDGGNGDDPNQGAVDAIEAAGADAPIFNLQGIRINGSADTLPAGLYIIGGQKVMIRK